MAVTELACGDTTFYVVGTAHVSQRSVEEVREVIARIAPDAVCVELDARRLAALTEARAFRDLDVAKAVREGRARAALAHLALAAYQKRLGAKLGVKPGAELLAAIHEAEARGIPAELIDRDIAVTLGRTWANLGAPRRALIVVALVVGGRGAAAEDPVTATAVEDLKEPKALSDLLAELGRAIPEVKAPLVDERDQWLASRLREVGAGKRRVVAVVGAAHVAGIAARLAALRGTAEERAAIAAVPPPSALRRALAWLAPAAFLALLALCARSGDPVALMRAWMLPTAIGAGLAVLAARGHLVAALAAAVAAPIAVLHPLAGTGHVAGRLQARLARPTAADLAALPDELSGLGSYLRNRATRVLLVAAAASLGAGLGFAVGAIRVALRLV